MLKKIIKSAICIASVFCLMILNTYCNAVMTEIKYKSINEKIDVEVDGLYFKQISFINNSGEFGLEATVSNNSNINKEIYTEVIFYDKEYHLVKLIQTNRHITGNFKDFNYRTTENVSNLYNGNTVQDICYYTIRITTQDDRSVTSNNSSVGVNNSNSNVIPSAGTVKPNNTTIQDSNKYDYVISNYNIAMVVNENNTFDITETITANFNVPKHGIFRKIPLQNSVSRLDGSYSRNKAQISKLQVNENYTAENEKNYKVIKIGKANETLTGSHVYTIKYRYNIGKDPLENADELYFNLIGNEWDTTISNVSFKIIMPKEFDRSTLGFSSGNYGSIDNSNIKYNVVNNIIEGSVEGTLNPKEALTIRLTLPEEYFVGERLSLDNFSLIIRIASVAFLITAFLLWKKYGKDHNIVETVEFYPPEGFNSLEIGIINDGVVTDKSIISLLIYLADKGYLKIEEIEDENKEKTFKITRLKEYDGTDRYEKWFFEGIFKKVNPENLSMSDYLDSEKKLNSIQKEITLKELHNRFYSTINDIKRNIKYEEKLNKLFDSTSKGKIKWLVIMMIVIFLSINIQLIQTDIGMPFWVLLVIGVIFPGVGVFCINRATAKTVTVTSEKVFMAIMSLGVVMPWYAVIFPLLQENTEYLINFIVGIICILGILVLTKLMPRATKEGAEILGRIRGFKRFLKIAEKSQLEKLVMENPEYFYNILPYTYALGISDKWIKQFETMALESPKWYDSNDNITRFMTSSMDSVTREMKSMPRSSYSSGISSGGGSFDGGYSGGNSGGGYSGGGSGGGGGGSW